MDIYAENILEHYRAPRGKHPLPDASVTHREVNWSCGDDLTVSLRLEDGHLAGLGWEGQGCAISQAGMSMLSEELVGKSLKELAALGPADIRALLGVPIGPRRFKCALLPVHCLRNALRLAEGLPPQDWLETVGEDRELAPGAK